jgi:antitoxin MazE
MQSIIKQWGDSLVLKIPESLYNQAGFKAGSKVELSIEGKKLIMSPTEEDSLDNLLDCITEENIHCETNFSHPIGNEIW